MESFKERVHLHNRERASQEQVRNLHLSTVNPPDNLGGTHSSGDAREPPIDESHDAIGKNLNRH